MKIKQRFHNVDIDLCKSNSFITVVFICTFEACHNKDLKADLFLAWTGILGGFIVGWSLKPYILFLYQVVNM